jgi:hypothetical protein
MTEQPVEKFDFLSVPPPVPVQQLNALQRIEVLLKQLLDVLTPVVVGRAGPVVLEDAEGRAAKIAAVVPRDARKPKRF